MSPLLESDFKALKKAWCGTPTGDVCETDDESLREEKAEEDSQGNPKGVMTSTAEHHDEIREHLTQHARLGTIEWASRPKGSKETRRLLAEKEIKYVDGGRHFIPVDSECLHRTYSKRDTQCKP